jgi:hypothetical protein
MQIVDHCEDVEMFVHVTANEMLTRVAETKHLEDCCCVSCVICLENASELASQETWKKGRKSPFHRLAPTLKICARIECLTWSCLRRHGELQAPGDFCMNRNRIFL